MNSSQPKGIGGVQFVGSDGSVLDSLPSDILGGDMCPLSIQLDKFSAREGGASAAAPPPPPQAPPAPPPNYDPTSITPFGKGGDLQAFMGERSERALTDDSRCPDVAESDGEAFADGLLEPENTTVKAEESESRGMRVGDASGHIADDDDFGGEGGVGVGGVSAGKKRKKEVMKGPGEGASEAQKAKASRDRNREHARNTRIRKKQYLENLKLQVGEMLQAKAREERDSVLDCSKLSAERAARRHMVLNMFYLRATEDLSPHAWASILDEEFTCIMPITPFRSNPPEETREDHRLITGIDGMIKDTASLAVFIQSISRRSQNPTGQQVKYQFYTSPEDTVVGPDGLMCRWLMKTENAIECGSKCEVLSHGMLRARFSPQNRIKHLELVFDVMGFMQQLQRALGGEGFRVIPNTLEAALQPSRHARLVCSAEPPYWITHVNEAWTVLMGHSLEEAKLFCFSLMNGPAEANNGGELDAFIHACIGSNLKRAGIADVHVITRDMRRVTVAVQAYPLGTTEGVTTHLLLVMEEVSVCATLPQPGLELFPFV